MQSLRLNFTCPPERVAIDQAPAYRKYSLRIWLQRRVEVTDTPALIALCDHEREARRCLDDLPVFRSCEYVKAGKDSGGIGVGSASNNPQW